MKINIKILIGLLAIFFVAALFWILSIPRIAEGITDRQKYDFGDALEIEIKNNLGETVCFSSCYPYFLERMDGDGAWNEYAYDECPYADLAADCVPADEIKKFRLMLADVERGQNRLKMPVCVNCGEGDEFVKESVIYSNKFRVN